MERKRLERENSGKENVKKDKSEYEYLKKDLKRKGWRSTSRTLRSTSWTVRSTSWTVRSTSRTCGQQVGHCGGQHGPNPDMGGGY